MSSNYIFAVLKRMSSVLQNIFNVPGHNEISPQTNVVIKEEFILGRNGLDQEYIGLFRGNVTRILNSPSETKKLLATLEKRVKTLESP